MDKYMLQLFILSTLILQITTISGKKPICFLSRRIRIYAVNQLPPNSPALLLRCQSGNHDLGYQTLYYPGQEFTFNFCINFRTLFFCHFWWSGKDLSFEVFNNLGEHRRRCDDNNLCYYEVRSDGIYFSKERPPKELKMLYGW
ncbi:hypothetical protein CASFOL_022164 [Castilleja foliolosa]|uniref:S-protein homolog n=1 Tax=Castilleja foliolosa TaxID=1961234 RepID=A0ABD3D2D9_9LAMI